MTKGICNCVEEVDAKLAAEGFNTRLGHTLHMVRRGKLGEMVSLPMLTTMVVEKKRGARAKLVIPSFCPFCGKKYDLETSEKEKSA